VFSTIYKLKEDLQEQITENEKYLGEVSKSLDKFSGQFEEVNTFMHEKIEQMENS
jgi:hypothetical protein